MKSVKKNREGLKTFLDDTFTILDNVLEGSKPELGAHEVGTV